jgi:hypothetical protein
MNQEERLRELVNMAVAMFGDYERIIDQSIAEGMTPEMRKCCVLNELATDDANEFLKMVERFRIDGGNL